MRDGRRATEYQQALRESVSKDTQMVVILMDGQKKDIYDMVKKYCILENPGGICMLNCCDASLGVKCSFVTWFSVF